MTMPHVTFRIVSSDFFKLPEFEYRRAVLVRYVFKNILISFGAVGWIRMPV
jgi:hypothetical protein